MLNVAPARSSNSRASSPSFSRWALLNPYTARHSGSFTLGVVGLRPNDERRENIGYSVALGESVSTVSGCFLVGGHQQQELRLVPREALQLSLSRYLWEAGPRLGRFEPSVRVGFTSLHFDYGHRGLAFGMFSPRVGLGAWLKLPHTRVGLNAFSEYLWRWIGGPGAFVHGLELSIEPEAKPLIGAANPAR